MLFITKSLLFIRTCITQRNNDTHHSHWHRGIWKSRGQIQSAVRIPVLFVELLYRSPFHTIGKQYVLHPMREDRKSTRLNSSHVRISYAVFCLKKKKKNKKK